MASYGKQYFPLEFNKTKGKHFHGVVEQNAPVPFHKKK